MLFIIASPLLHLPATTCLGCIHYSSPWPSPRSLWKQNAVVFLASQTAHFPGHPPPLWIHPADSCAGSRNTSGDETKRCSAVYICACC